MSNIPRRVGVAAMLAIAATGLWLRRVDHTHRPGTVAKPTTGVGLVVVASRPIAAGDMIEPTFIGIARRPIAAIPAEAFSHVDNVMGRVASVNIATGDVITTTRLAGPRTPPGLDPLQSKRTLLLHVDARESDASIQPNGTADLVLVPGLGDSDRGVETIVQGVRVLRIDSLTENHFNARWSPITVATIEVTGEQQERLATALANWRFRIALRRHVDSGRD